MKKTTDAKKGFTILEVVLVLALAGLIFLMVFITFPRLQRSQRDAERKDDMMLLVEKLKEYQTNNRGTLPIEIGTNTEGDKIIEQRPTDQDMESLHYSPTSWEAFYHDYLGGDFADPRDGVYRLEPRACDAVDELGSGPSTSGQLEQGDKCNYTDPPYDHTIHLFTQATCEEDHAIKAANPRDFAVVYRTESSGIYCFGS